MVKVVRYFDGAMTCPKCGGFNGLLSNLYTTGKLGCRDCRHEVAEEDVVFENKVSDVKGVAVHYDNYIALRDAGKIRL